MMRYAMVLGLGLVGLVGDTVGYNPGGQIGLGIGADGLGQAQSLGLRHPGLRMKVGRGLRVSGSRGDRRVSLGLRMEEDAETETTARPVSSSVPFSRRLDYPPMGSLYSYANEYNFTVAASGEVRPEIVEKLGVCFSVAQQLAHDLENGRIRMAGLKVESGIEQLESSLAYDDDGLTSVDDMDEQDLLPLASFEEDVAVIAAPPAEVDYDSPEDITSVQTLPDDLMAERLNWGDGVPMEGPATGIQLESPANAPLMEFAGEEAVAEAEDDVVWHEQLTLAEQEEAIVTGEADTSLFSDEPSEEEAQVEEEWVPHIFEYSLAGESGGEPKENQDCTFALTVESHATEVVGVFDGHGPAGAVVSQYVAATIGDSMQSMVEQTKHKIGSRQFRKKIMKIFEETDASLAEAVEDYVDLYFDGATGCVAIRKGKHLVVGHVGDSRCILGTVDGKARRLTMDHVPAAPGERERIEAAGGECRALEHEPDPEESGTGRVFVAGQQFPGLAVSRAFGDKVGKAVGVTVRPDVSYRKLGNKDTVLILASDGLWDVVSDEEAVEIALNYASTKDAILTSADLVETARHRWVELQDEFESLGGHRPDYPIDDISAIALFL